MKPIPQWLKDCRIPSWMEVVASYNKGEYIPVSYLTKDGRLLRPKSGNNPFLSPKFTPPVVEETELSAPCSFKETPVDSMRAEFNYLRNTINGFIDKAKKNDKL